MSDCMINPYSSRVCVLGTKSCVMKHTGIVERDEQIKELKAEIERLREKVVKWQNLAEMMYDGANGRVKFLCKQYFGPTGKAIDAAMEGE